MPSITTAALGTDPRTFRDMAEVRRFNDSIGNHWFSRDTLRFFGSRVQETAPYGGRFFVTSEHNLDRTERRYTVREALSDGTIGEVGGFLEYATRSQAVSAAKCAAREWTAANEGRGIVRHGDGTPDTRYSIALEWTGHEYRRWVARFEGEHIATGDTQSVTYAAAVMHRNDLLAP